MEAPKVHFENMDAQVDPVQHDHPGLQAPVYRDNHNIALDDDDIEDNVDGQIPHDYHEDKVLNYYYYFLFLKKIFKIFCLKNFFQAPNQRYDHLNDIDYDFQADFHQPKRVIPKPRQTFQHHPLIVQDQHYRHAQLAPQVAGHHPFPYRRGL